MRSTISRLASALVASSRTTLSAIREETVSAEASREMVERIRRELAEISNIVLR